MRFVPSLSILAIAAAVGGCASKDQPVTFLTLNPAPPTAAVKRAHPGPPLMVAPVELPPAIDRLYLTTDGGGATLAVSSTARWAGPLSELFRMALAQDLAARLPKLRVLMPGDTAPQSSARTVQVNLQRFRPGVSGEVTLDADWSIAAPNGGGTTQEHFHVALPGPPQPGPEAATMSAAVGKLADAIAGHS